VAKRFRIPRFDRDSFDRYSELRPPEENLIIRFPRLSRACASVGGLLWALIPYGSAIRKALMVHGVRRSYAAFNRRDVEALQVIHRPDCVFDMSDISDWPERSTYEGHEGLREYLEDWHGQWSEVRFEPVQVSEPSRGILLIESHVRATGRASGLDVEASFFQVGEPKRGLVWRVRNYTDGEEARRAATG
jgi:ketosteroid isomerase-like protein